MSNRLVLELCFTSLLLLLGSEKSPIESKSLLSGAFVSFSGSSHCSLGIVSSSVSSWDSWKIAAEGCNDWELESFASLDDLTFSSIFRFLKGYYRTYEHFIKKASKTFTSIGFLNKCYHAHLPVFGAGQTRFHVMLYVSCLIAWCCGVFFLTILFNCQDFMVDFL